MATIYGRIPSPQVKKDTKVIDSKVYGINYPFGTTRGFFSKSTGISLIKNNLTQLLKTTKGERIMLPNFGMNLKKYLFEPLDKNTFNSIQSEILYSIAQYLPQIDIIKLSVVSNEEVNLTGTQGLLVTLVCQVKDLDNQLVEVNLNIL